MDIAYDHIQEEILASNGPSKSDDGSADANQRPNLNLSAEFQETFRAFSNSPWGIRIGGILDNVRKQGESYYEGARQEYAAASEEAVKGLSDLRNSIVGRTRGLSLGGALSGKDSKKQTDDTATPTASEKKGAEGEEGESFIARFRAEAAKRLKDIERAEDAADEALLRFGTNIRNFLRDAVRIAPPDEGSSSDKGKVLFESKDPEGKRVFHATRFEAQLHVIHTNLESFSKDPVSDEWPAFKQSFNVESKTDDITKDLEAYPELRRAMEKLVPEKVEYADFWSRYYFLRLVVETEEKKRKELLKGASTAADEEEVGWDEDSDSESDSPSTPQVKSNKQSAASSHLAVSDDNTLKPVEPRRSNDQQSQPDSESSYDLVSGANSRTPGSPREKPANTKADESDEEDWE
ncbi:hypothetical protein VTN77DRAFT_6617 [Rasamsonia byssochlamydoides]|uniref:uncharacterized protein n=1 Tax=Rasamsonia byssochlamydoides TaxID=89139 RepID=UPI0037423AB6